MPNPRPVILSISGHDPSGGAGIQADIETSLALGCHSCTVITALTVQDTVDISKIIPQPAEQVEQQLRLLFDDLPIRCVKIGLIGSPETANAIASVIRTTDVPVVLDPVLAAGGGFDFSNRELVDSLVTQLIPLSTVITPNSHEARRLIETTNNLDECGRCLNRLGCDHVLVTGAHEQSPEVNNVLYRSSKDPLKFSWKRLAGNHHGSGCTLASAVTALLAHGQPPLEAVSNAQDFTWKALEAGIRSGKGQSIPNRFHGLSAP
jgi:hydroxymethylpyrimidine/phosphomethylpyrimidine kinase